MLALAGVLVGHTVGYAGGHGAHGGGHWYVFPALAVVGPLAVIVGTVSAVAEARRVGIALELSVARLLGAQAALYTVLEVGERLVHGHLGTITGASVALGLLAQLPVALALHGLVRLARRAAHRLFSGPVGCRQPLALRVWPTATDGSRPRWSPISSRAPPSLA